MRLVFPGLFSMLAVFFAWLLHQRYWTWRDCIAAAQSSCVTPDGDNLTAGGIVWAIAALLFAAAALASWLHARRR